MMQIPPNTIKYGSNIIFSELSNLDSFIIVTQTPPYNQQIKKNLENYPLLEIFPVNVDIIYLEQLLLEIKNSESIKYIVGLGGGVAIDTAKFLSWKLGKNLIQIPSIISTDAFLTHEIGVRVKNKVRYIGKAIPDQIIVDFELIKSAPKLLNFAGTCDVLSICTALGDWRIAHEKFGEKIDPIIFNKARLCAQNLIDDAHILKKMDDEGIQKLVEYLQREIEICEEWGDARPEEGGEHHLAYCIEEISPKRYLHGALVALNILTVLRLQGKYAEFSVESLRNFFDYIGHSYRFDQIGITPEIYSKALKNIQDYVTREKLEKGLWFTENPFSQYSVSSIIQWINGF